MTKYRYFLLSRSKIAAIQKVLLGLKNHKKGSALLKSFCAGKTSPNGGTPLSALTTTRWELHLLLYLHLQLFLHLLAIHSCTTIVFVCLGAFVCLCIMPNMKFRCVSLQRSFPTSQSHIVTRIRRWHIHYIIYSVNCIYRYIFMVLHQSIALTGRQLCDKYVRLGRYIGSEGCFLSFCVFDKTAKVLIIWDCKFAPEVQVDHYTGGLQRAHLADLERLGTAGWNFVIVMVAIPFLTLSRSPASSQLL